MIEKYGLFDSLEGDERIYAETDFARLIQALVQDGVRGDADAAVAAFLAGELAYDPDAKCDHHGEHHHGDHDCGSHSCGNSCGGNHSCH